MSKYEWFLCTHVYMSLKYKWQVKQIKIHCGGYDREIKWQQQHKGQEGKQKRTIMRAVSLVTHIALRKAGWQKVTHILETSDH
jgi:hypothetical protein